MTQRQVQFLGAGGGQRGQRQVEDLEVGLEAGMAEQLDPHLHRAASALMLVRGGAQHVGAVAQPHRALALEGVGVHAGHLGGDVGADAHHAAGELVGELEGLQIEVGAGAGKQGVEELHGGGHHLVVAPAVIEVEQRAAQLLHAARLGRQHLVHAVGQQPAVSDGHVNLPARQ